MELPQPIEKRVSRRDGDKIFLERRSVMPIRKELLDILACPKCKGDIVLNERKDGLICHNCNLIFEIRDGIPIMLIDEAKPFSDS